MRRSESRDRPLPGAWGALEDVQRLQPLRPAHGDVRVQRRRRPADLGASDLASRAHSTAAGPRREAGGGPLAEAGASVAPSLLACGGCAPGRGEPGPATSPLRGAAARGCSVPATGTAKADGAARQQAKAHAVAALNRLFFEEIAKGGQDPNAAAAAALRRLMEASSQRDATGAPLDGGCTEDFGMPGLEAPAPLPRPPSEILEVGEDVARGGAGGAEKAAAAARPPAPLPRRPKEVLGRVRRPSPAIRVGN